MFSVLWVTLARYIAMRVCLGHVRNEFLGLKRSSVVLLRQFFNDARLRRIDFLGRFVPTAEGQSELRYRDMPLYIVCLPTPARVRIVIIDARRCRLQSLSVLRSLVAIASEN
eukprot:TRINITY_DN19888_c0_g2_i2.p1 TRINITY_DN19888_c0_g2~~TRINITY_DN19888_c0_g2_i2.p1  ORF type:complete len:112 (+),score=1.44 TRINITY_DN19888_c0_g2_i2:267-602(+)